MYIFTNIQHIARRIPPPASWQPFLAAPVLASSQLILVFSFTSNCTCYKPDPLGILLCSTGFLQDRCSCGHQTNIVKAVKGSDRKAMHLFNVCSLYVRLSSCIVCTICRRCICLSNTWSQKYLTSGAVSLSWSVAVSVYNLKKMLMPQFVQYLMNFD